MFKVLNRILYKSKYEPENINSDPEVVPYMLQRWASMYSPEIAVLLNETSNKHWSILEDKEAWYMYLDTIIPKCRYRKFSYIKKSKPQKSNTEKIDKEMLNKVAQSLEISSREVSQYIEQYNLTLPKSNV